MCTACSSSSPARFGTGRPRRWRASGSGWRTVSPGSRWTTVSSPGRPTPRPVSVLWCGSPRWAEPDSELGAGVRRARPVNRSRNLMTVDTRCPSARRGELGLLRYGYVRCPSWQLGQSSTIGSSFAGRSNGRGISSPATTAELDRRGRQRPLGGGGRGRGAGAEPPLGDDHDDGDGDQDHAQFRPVASSTNDARGGTRAKHAGRSAPSCPCC